MARIPDSELERIKGEVSPVRLIEGQGMTLLSQGKDLACRCPWHEGDDTPSCVMTPKTDLWHCFGCDAGGDDAEEEAVCYLQVLMGEVLPLVTRSALFADMDAWGYSFRLGSTAAWFGADAQDARAWLQEERIIDERGRLTGRRRGE